MNVLESGLTVHNRVIKHLITNSKNNKNSDEVDNSTYNDSQTNFEHMQQLNKHLVSCLNLLNNDLDDFL